MEVAEKRARIACALKGQKTVWEALRAAGHDELRIRQLADVTRKGLRTTQSVQDLASALDVPPEYFIIENDFDAIECLRRHQEAGDE